MMTATTTENDDGEELVAQVIAENPVEEQGLREEWAGHVGWRRKEDIFGISSNGRLRGSSPAAAAEATAGAGNKREQDFHVHFSASTGNIFSSFQSFGAVVAVLAACASLWFALRIVYKKSKKNKRDHHRSS